MIQRRIGLLTRTVSFVQRYRQILFVLLKYGFDDLIANLRLEQYLGGARLLLRLRRAPKVAIFSRAARLRLALEELGPTFVKMGQNLSTRSDLLADELLAEMVLLQDHVQPFPTIEVRAIIQQELGKPCEEVFAHFEDTPLAAGSIGQVHRAQTQAGDAVAVKVQRPGIRKQIKVDLEIIHYIASLMERHMELGQLHKPTRIADEFARTLEQELDYTIEAGNIGRFNSIFENNSNIYVHKIFREVSTSKILTTEYVEGAKPSDVKALQERGLNPQLIASKGADLVISQVFIHGFFHADPHPGNLLVLPGNIICFLDFGMMGRIDYQSRELFADLLMNVIVRNETKAADTLLKLTHGHSLVDRLGLEREIAELIDQYLFRSLKEVQVGKLIRQLMNLTVKHELSIPAHFFLLIKALSQVEDLGRSLNPNFDLTEQAGPYIRKLLLNRYRPKRMVRDIYETGTDMVYLLKEVPGEVRELLKQARQGKFKIELDHRRIGPIVHSLERVSNRVSSAIVLGSLIVGSSLIVLAGVPPVFFNIPVIGLAGYVVSGIMGISLLFSIWKNREK